MPYFKQHKILTLPSLYIMEVAVFVKSNPNRFKRLADVVPRNRRDNNQVCSHPAKTALLRKSVYCMGPVIYNKLPKQWKELPLTIFKTRLKRFLTHKAYYNISEFLTEKEFVCSPN